MMKRWSEKKEERSDEEKVLEIERGRRHGEEEENEQSIQGRNVREKGGGGAWNRDRARREGKGAMREGEGEKGR